MPKATLTFDLPEEREEFDTAVHGIDYKLALSDFRNFLRSKLKYSELSEQEHKIYEEVSDKFFEIVNENGVEV